MGDEDFWNFLMAVEQLSSWKWSAVRKMLGTINGPPDDSMRQESLEDMHTFQCNLDSMNSTLGHLRSWGLTSWSCHIGEHMSDRPID